MFDQLDDLGLMELTTLFVTTAPKGMELEDRKLWYQELAVRIARTGFPGYAYLRDKLQGSDEVRLEAIILAFSFLPSSASSGLSAELRDMLTPFLTDCRPLVVMTAVDTLRHLDCEELLPTVLPLLHHDSPYVVGSVLRFLSKYDPVNALPILLAALTAPDPIVRQNAVDELAQLGVQQAVPQIKELLKDQDHFVREAAAAALEELGGPESGQSGARGE